MSSLPAISKEQAKAVASQRRLLFLGARHDLGTVERQLEQAALNSSGNVRDEATRAANALVLVVEKLRRGVAP